MFNTLESVMKLDYPTFEVIFAVQDENDEALPVVKMVMDKYPDVPARVIISESDRREETHSRQGECGSQRKSR